MRNEWPVAELWAFCIGMREKQFCAEPCSAPGHLLNEASLGEAQLQVSGGRPLYCFYFRCSKKKTHTHTHTFSANKTYSKTYFFKKKCKDTVCSSLKLLLYMCVSNVLPLRQGAGRRGYLIDVLSWGGARAHLGGNSGEVGGSSGGVRREPWQELRRSPRPAVPAVPRLGRLSRLAPSAARGSGSASSAMEAERLMVLFGDDSVEVHYTGGSRLLLSPCGSEYLYEAALPAAAHPLQPAETTRQRVAFVVSAYRVCCGQCLRGWERCPSSLRRPRDHPLGSAGVTSLLGNGAAPESWPQQEFLFLSLKK